MEAYAWKLQQFCFFKCLHCFSRILHESFSKFSCLFGWWFLCSLMPSLKICVRVENLNLRTSYVVWISVSICWKASLWNAELQKHKSHVACMNLHEIILWKLHFGPQVSLCFTMAQVIEKSIKSTLQFSFFLSIRPQLCEHGCLSCLNALMLMWLFVITWPFLAPGPLEFLKCFNWPWLID